MSLDFRLVDIPDQDTLCWDADEKGRTRVAPVTEALIFGTMRIGMNNFTHANIDEVVRRFTTWETEVGASLVQFTDDGIEPRPLTEDEIRAHIGLHTNASCFSRTDFERRLRREVKKVAAAKRTAAVH